jgi:hypothetical protein
MARVRPAPLLGQCLPMIQSTPAVMMSIAVQLQVIAIIRPLCFFAEAFLLPFSSTPGIRGLQYVL